MRRPATLINLSVRRALQLGESLCFIPLKLVACV